MPKLELELDLAPFFAKELELSEAPKKSERDPLLAWSIGSVRASGAVGPEFEPTFCHSLLSGGPWQDLVSSVRLEPLNCDGVVYHQE